MKLTEVRVTPGFALPCSIIFAQGPKVGEYDDRQVAIDLLLGTYQNILKTARNYGFDAILLPALGTGSYGFTHEETADAVMHLLNSFARCNHIEILFVLQSEKYVHMYSK
jgi:O-acetyl-ADP-ribose deacetylase (regulator of RNase III)